VDLSGSFPRPTLKYGSAFRDFVAAIQGRAFRDAVADKFRIDLSTRPTMVTVRRISKASDGRIHTDSRTKLITVLICMNGR
jgi:hypothetical protein